MTVTLDISRLISRQRFATPTGIDRFELSYARWLLDSGKEPVFVETGATGSSVVPAAAARNLIERVDRQWSATSLSQDEELQLRSIVAAIEGERPWRRTMAREPLSFSALPALMKSQAAYALRRMTSAFRPLPAENTFIHVSHARLHRPSAFSWLTARRPQAVFYVHDLIPLSHPEFVRQGEPERHMRRMRTVLSHASLVLCNSSMTAAMLDRLAERQGLPQPRSAVLPPGVNDAFLQLPGAQLPRSKRPYFVCIGTIEPRKNHALLLKLWRRLVERHGRDAPRLVIIGRRGWDNAELFKLLDNPGTLQDTVIEVSDLSDAPLTQLLAGAAALLAPSFVEGYGMPVAEALALGTPVIASRIDAHREITRGATTLLDPLDGGDWLKAIEAHAARHGSRRPHSTRWVTRPPWTWPDHFHALERLMAADRKVASQSRTIESGDLAYDAARWASPSPVTPSLTGWSKG